MLLNFNFWELRFLLYHKSSESRLTFCHVGMGKLWVARILWLSPELRHEGVHLRPKSHCKYEKSSLSNALIAFNVIRCYFIAMDSHKARQLIRDLWSWTASELITFPWSSLSGFTNSLLPYWNLNTTMDLLCISHICEIQ